ncbi:MAG: hypothetical protein HYR93_03280 [Chloroflexi bacterium]|nr:hypothetical protein [Chloroflexota bacterium]
MTWRTSLLLAFLGLALSFFIAQFQPFPGYLDSDYYFSGGIQLAQGKGFTEPYLWNYLDDPKSLPHPSHTYWMPLSSIIAAAGMWLTRQTTYQAGRLGFFLLAALIPVVTAALAYNFTKRRELAVVSGLLAVFSIYYAPFIGVPDNYGPYLFLGGLYFLTLNSRKTYSYFVLGLLAGFLTLARSDGLLWLGLTFLLIFFRFLSDKKPGAASINLLLVLGGFILISGPWFWRTYSIYGTFLAPGGRYLLWLKNYDETFSYPASQLTMQAWLAQGWAKIIGTRLAALNLNLLNTFAAQGGIFLFPFILIGLWQNRKDERVRLASIAWFGLLFVMTVVFPFAGARGGFFHAGAAFQPIWWTLAPLGLETVVAAARRRNMFTPDAFKLFRAALVAIAVLMTGVILYLRVLPGWGEGEQNYPKVEAFLQQNGIQPGEAVIVRNPPGYYLMTGRPAVVVPYGDETSMLAVAERYQAKYLIIESAGAAGPIKLVYDNQQSQQLRFLGELNGTRIFKIQP